MSVCVFEATLLFNNNKLHFIFSFSLLLCYYCYYGYFHFIVLRSCTIRERFNDAGFFFFVSCAFVAIL